MWVLLNVLLKMSARSSHAIVISLNKEEDSIVISSDESGDLPSVKYTWYTS